MPDVQPKYLVLSVWLFDILMVPVKIALYFVSFAGPVIILHAFRGHHPLVLLAVGLLCWPLAAVVFASEIVLFKRICVPNIRPGRFFVGSPAIRPWFLGIVSYGILKNSPFWPLIAGFPLTRYLLFKGMGAKIDPSFAIEPDVTISEPWALTVGKDVMIGGACLISSHKRERLVVSHMPIEIGDGATIGTRCTLMPGVKIGERALIGANSLVVSGTVVPPGEVWSGNPARKIGLTQA